MAFWSGETLAIRLPSLITGGYKPEMIDCSSYTMTIGPEVYITPDHKVEKVNSHTARFLDDGECFTIPPGQFGFLLTEETIEIPSDAMAFISMKSKPKHQGLLNASGFHVDPGFKGRLIFSVFNAGPRPIHLKRGMPLFLIWYANLDVRETTHKKGGKDQQAIDPDLINRISGEILSVHSITDQLKSMKEELNEVKSKALLSSQRQKFVYGMIVVMFLAIIWKPAGETISSFYKDDALIEEQRSDTKEAFSPESEQKQEAAQESE